MKSRTLQSITMGAPFSPELEWVRAEARKRRQAEQSSVYLNPLDPGMPGSPPSPPSPHRRRGGPSEPITWNWGPKYKTISDMYACDESTGELYSMAEIVNPGSTGGPGGPGGVQVDDLMKLQQKQKLALELIEMMFKM